MEAAIRTLLQTSLGEYVWLDNVDVSSFPLTLKDLKLREKKIQEDMEEDGDFPFDISDGRIGSIKVSPGWMGTVEICASDIVLNFAFSPSKAWKRAMKPNEPDEEEFEQHAEPQHFVAPPPPMQAPVPPRYCAAHGSSDRRIKVEPRFMECTSCHTKLQTNYQEFSLCPPCSEHHRRCMICGGHAPDSGSYVPAATLNQVPPAQEPRTMPPGPPPPGEPRRPPLPRHLQGIGDDSYGGLPPPPRPSGRESTRDRRDSERHPPRYGDGLPAPPPPPPRRDVSARDSEPPQQPGGWRGPDDLPPPPPIKSHRDRDRDGLMTPPGANFPLPPPQGMQQQGWSGRGTPPMGPGGPPGGYPTPPQSPYRNRAGGGSGPNGSRPMRDPYASYDPNFPPQQSNRGPKNLMGPDDGSFMGILRNMDISKWVSCMTATGAHGEGAQELVGPAERFADRPPEQVPFPPYGDYRGPRQREQRGGA